MDTKPEEVERKEQSVLLMRTVPGERGEGVIKSKPVGGTYHGSRTS